MKREDCNYYITGSYLCKGDNHSFAKHHLATRQQQLEEFLDKFFRELEKLKKIAISKECGNKAMQDIFISSFKFTFYRKIRP